MSGTIPKVLRPFADEAIRQGWRIEKTARCHLKWRAPTGALVVTSSTPSDQRAVRNIVSDLKRGGLKL